MRLSYLHIFPFFLILLFLNAGCKQELFVECESFEDQGGWVVDPQFVEQMGSPYLMAHGLGQSVENAKTTVHIPSGGSYHVWARTTDWAPGGLIYGSMTSNYRKHWEMISDEWHQVDNAEQIRDHMLKAIFGSFFNEKKRPGSENLKLEWVSFLLGKRESRRLVGDYLYTFNDMRDSSTFPDAVVVEEREVDVHYRQDELNPELPDFLSDAMFYHTDRYFIPYRSLYSKNINNLLMAGRCFSCSHVGLGGPRVMRTTGQMGAAVGYAASLCTKHRCSPRDLYAAHLDEYMQLILSSDETTAP